MPQLLGIHHIANALHVAAGDVDRHHADQAIGGIEDHHPGLRIDLRRANADACADELSEQAVQQARNAIASEDGLRDCGDNTAAVAVEGRIRGEEEE